MIASPVDIVKYWDVMGGIEGSRQPGRKVLSPDFVRGFFTLFVFLAAYHSLTPTLPLYLAQMGCDEREIGMLVGIGAIACLVSRLVAGGAVVRYSEKAVMIAGALFSALSFLAYVALAPFWPLFLARFLQGLAFACVDTAVLAFVVRVTPEKYRGQALGYSLAASPLAMAIAASLGVFLSDRYGYIFLFLACIALSLCSLLFALTVKGPRREDKGAQPVSAPGSRFIDLKVVVPAVVTFVNYFAGGALFTFIPLYGVECGIANPGFFFTAVAVMLFGGRIFGGRALGADKDKTIPVFLLMFAVALAVLSFSGTLLMFIVVGLIWGGALAFFVPASMAYALEYAGSSKGTALGTYQMFMDFGLAVGPMVMGMVLPYTGYPLMFLSLAFVALLDLAYFQFCVKQRKAR
jgi:predicted MFS family arabinose efflux permease